MLRRRSNKASDPRIRRAPDPNDLHYYIWRWYAQIAGGSDEVIRHAIAEEDGNDITVAGDAFTGKERHLVLQPIAKAFYGIDLRQRSQRQADDAHEYLFWLNNEPGDAVRRHLIAARWKDWRLYRKYAKDPWQLFDLKADPREEADLATKYPDAVKQLAAQHAEWEKTLAPLGTIPENRPAAPIVPAGHGSTSSTVPAPPTSKLRVASTS